MKEVNPKPIETRTYMKTWSCTPLPVWAIFVYSKHKKTYYGTLGTQESTTIGSKPCLGPSMGRTWSCNWTL